MSEACVSAQEGAQLKLEQARERYRISKAAEEQIAAELETLKTAEKTSPEMIKNYEQYRDRSHAITQENRNVVLDLEAVYSKGRKPRKALPAEKTLPGTSLSGAPLPEEQELDPLEALDSRLNDSLAEFDESLLKEMDEILEKSRDRMKELAKVAAEAAGRLEKESGGAEPSETPPGQAPGDKPKAAGEQRPGDGSVAAGADDSGQGPPSGLSAQDDDVVARQLREAAEAETDPELKKKLWQEYENYKKGSGL